MRLPEIDGFQVADHLRSNRHTRDVPIVFLTEKLERKGRKAGDQAGKWLASYSDKMDEKQGPFDNLDSLKIALLNQKMG